RLQGRHGGDHPRRDGEDADAPDRRRDEDERRVGNGAGTPDEARRAGEELQGREVRARRRRQGPPDDRDSAGHPDRGRAGDRQVHQGPETQEGPGVDSGRTGACHVAVKRRAAARHAAPAGPRFRRLAQLRELPVKYLHMKTPALILLTAATLAAATVYAQGRTTADGVGTDAQVKRGAEVYSAQCATCHDAQLAGSGTAPALAGTDFSANWKDENVGSLFERIRATMP